MAVTLGDPQETREFCGARAPGLRCLSDSEERAYRAFGLGKAGAAELVSADVVVGFVRAIAEGHGAGPVVGDSRQMPGTFVIGRGGRVLMAHYSRTIADHPEARAVLAALDAAG